MSSCPVWLLSGECTSNGTRIELLPSKIFDLILYFRLRKKALLFCRLYQQGDSGELALRVGSLIFGHIGQLLPHQLRSFHVKDFIYPV